MIKELLSRQEDKTLEFKENTSSLQKIIQTVVAFANTSGGTLVVGVQDKTKKIIGIKDVLLEEERLSSAIADSIEPLLIPSFQFVTWRNKDLLLVLVPYSFGPYYVKSKGIEGGTYVRFGSTNRIADQKTIDEIKRLKGYKHFDEQPNISCPLEDIDIRLAKKLFDQVSKKFTDQAARSLGLMVSYQEKLFASNGAVLLFCHDNADYFSAARIRLGRFAGVDKTDIIDHQDLVVPLAIALDQIVAFITRHTSTAAVFEGIRRRDVPQYPLLVVREAVTNALLHADYSVTGASIQIAIFDDRIEITNPGCLPFGLSMEVALSGVSQLRNRVIGRVFRELEVIEQWGSGLGRMIAICQQQGLPLPKFEELGNFFRVTLYHQAQTFLSVQGWYKPIVDYLNKHQEISPKKAQEIWKVTARTTSSRLKKMCDEGLLVQIATDPFDPQKVFSLSKRLISGSKRK